MGNTEEWGGEGQTTEGACWRACWKVCTLVETVFTVRLSTFFKIYRNMH